MSFSEKFKRIEDYVIDLPNKRWAQAVSVAVAVALVSGVYTSTRDYFKLVKTDWGIEFSLRDRDGIKGEGSIHVVLTNSLTGERNNLKYSINQVSQNEINGGIQQFEAGDYIVGVWYDNLDGKVDGKLRSFTFP